MKTLIVDDDTRVLESLAELFRLKNYPLASAKSGKEALSILSKDADVGIVVTDILMPEMDGFELCRHIKSDFPHVKVIAISGGISNILAKNRVKECQSSGMNYILQKPFTWDALIDAINQVR